jgi:hypothetical protein
VSTVSGVDTAEDGGLPDSGQGRPSADDAAADAQQSDAADVADANSSQDVSDADASNGGDATDEDVHVTAPDATATDAAGPDGASRDADSSAPVFDAALDASDAAPDAPATGCAEDTFRCSQYQLQQCTSGIWTWLSGPQECCHNDRFVVVGNTVHDTATGLVWYRGGGDGSSVQGAAQLCAVVLPNGRLPTTAELLAITIGPPINNFAVCSPTLDNQAFINVDPGETYTSDGCVDLVWATSSNIQCPNREGAGFLCVSSGP